MTANDEDKLDHATSLIDRGDDEQYVQSAFVAKQVKILYDNVGLALLGTVAAAAFATYFFLGSADTASLLIWFGILVLVTLIRYALVLTYRYATPLQNDKSWLAVFDTGSLLSGLTWGIVPVLIITDNSFQELLVLTFIIGGLSAGTVASYSVSKWASPLFSFAAIAPLTVSLHFSESEFTTPVKYLAIVFLVSMILLSRKQYKIAHEAITFSLQNADLVRYLSDTLKESSRLNSELRSEAQSRKEAEEASIKNEARYRNLSDATFEGILIHEDGEILDANHALSKMSGYEVHDLIGRNVMDFVAPEYQSVIRQRLDSPYNEPVEITAVKRNGRRFPVELASRDASYMGHNARVVAVRDLTASKAVERSLRMSERRLSRYMKQTLLAIVEWDTDFKVSDWNPAAEKIFGYSREEAIGRYAYDLILCEDETTNAREVWSKLMSDKQPTLFTHKNITRNGEHIICEWDATPVLDDEGTVTGVVSLAHDITERVHAEEALFHEKELAEVTLSSLGDGVITTNKQGEIDYLNPVAEVLMGWSLDEAHGKPVNDIFKIENDKTGERYEGLAELAMGDNTRDLSKRHTVLIQRSGDTVPVVFTGSPLRNYNHDVIGAVIVFRDVSELRQLENRLSYEASHDSLTGLMNRREFESRLSQAISVATERKVEHALLYLDLDQFKVVNDTCGHVAGDELLKQLSSQLRDKIRDSDSLARLGGDEFGVLLDGCPLERAEGIAQSIRDLVGKFRFTWDSKTFEAGVSIGVVPITTTSASMAEVMSSADTACYVAKERGRNRVHVYHEDDTAVAQRHGEMQWVHRIREAIEEDRIVLYVQKIYSLDKAERSPDHYEVLMRMLDKDGKIVPPMAFIPAAERYDMMVQLDKHVVTKALSSITSLARKSASHKDTVFSINLSGQSLCSNDFLDKVVGSISDCGVATTKLCFEVTETAAIGNLVHAKRFISVLRGMGCAFSLDDFGSGLSSFGYLKNLDVNYLKIDGSFVRDMVNDKVDDAMVQSIHQVGKTLNMKTIAEFVEDNKTIARLRDIGVDYAQGYGIEKPKPIEELSE